jgi:adenosylhomocysteinase
MSMAEATKIGGFFCTVTGDINMIDLDHFKAVKDGAIVANAGQFNVEINIPALRKMSVGDPNLSRPFVDQYTTKDGRKIKILGEGRWINPASVMDMSFANQALSTDYMAKNADKLWEKVDSPRRYCREIARLKLEAHRKAGKVSGLVGKRHLEIGKQKFPSIIEPRGHLVREAFCKQILGHPWHLTTGVV